MFEWFWRMVGAWACSPRGFKWLCEYAIKTKREYKPIYHGRTLYMGRFWVIRRRWNLPSVRLHWILKPDNARDLHSHPFHFRTIILRGWYMQEVPGKYWPSQKNDTRLVKMRPGMQSTCGYGQFHRITQVSKGGCWTLFIMWGGKRKDWGFMTKNGYVPAAEYKGTYKVEHV